MMLQPIGKAPVKPQGDAGFSLIEVMIAALIILFISLGVIPLFTSGMQSNVEGSEYTRVTSFARERLESLWNLPSDHELLTLTAGTSREIVEHYSENEKVWKEGAEPAAGDSTLWIRRTLVEQFNIPELEEAQDQDREPNPLTFDAPSSQVHVKRLTVEVRGTRGAGPLRSPARFTVLAYKWV